MNLTNKQPGVLIIDGHVQALALTRSLGEQNIPVYIVDRNSYGIARYSKYCLKFFKSPDYLAEEFSDFLLDIGKKEGLKDWLLLPCDDHIVYSISKRKTELQRIYKVITVDFNILHNIINKRNLFSVAERSGLPVIKTHYPENWHLSENDLAGLRFPMLIKGIQGQTFYKKNNAKAFRVSEPEELQRTLLKVSGNVAIQDIMIQEMIPLGESNKVISFTAFCVNGEVKAHWMGQKIREHPVNFGTATCSQSIINQIVVDQGKSLINALGYDGVCEIEFLQDPRDGNYYLIEINPRTWLWVGLAKACGINYAIMIYKYVNSIPQDFPEKYSIGNYWKNEITDLIFTYIGLLTGRVTFRSFFQHLLKPKLHALNQRGDSKPFLMFFLLLPYIFFKRR